LILYTLMYATVDANFWSRVLGANME